MSIPAEFKRLQLAALNALCGRDRPERTPRKTFSKKMRQAIAALQGDLCAACEDPLGEHFDIDHINPLALTGTNNLENLVALHPECHAPKTKKDVKAIAKARRIGKRETQGPKPSRLKSRGFDKSKSKRFNGAVTDRKPKSQPARSAEQ